MENEQTTTTTTTSPAAPAPAAPATREAPARPGPSTSKPGERQAALSAAEAQRRIDRGPRLKGQGPADAAPAAPDAPKTTGYVYDPKPAGDEPEKIKLADDLELTRAEIDDIRAQHALETSRKASLPADPSGYRLELPADYTAPAGLDFSLSENDPLVQQYRALAHRKGISQELFSDGLGVVMSVRAAEAVQLKGALEKEVGKLGTNAGARVDAVNQWVDAIAGPDAAAIKTVFKMAPVASTIIAFEKMIQRFQSQGITPFNQAHRAGEPDPNKIPGYATMSFEQKRDFQERQRAHREGR